MSFSLREGARPAWIGVPKEIKDDEFRVALTPAGARQLAETGHRVLLEKGAGRKSGFEDSAYQAAGAVLAESAADVFRNCDLIVKVKEPQAGEVGLLRDGQVVFTYFHLVASKELTQGCLNAGISALAYETLEDFQRRLPLLTPMSEIAGRMAAQEGAKYLESPMSGSGTLLGGIPGVAPAEVLILGGGVAGSHAAKITAGMGAQITVLDVNLERLRVLAQFLPANVATRYCEPEGLEECLHRADLVIGAVLVPGAKAPKLIQRRHLGLMKPGSVIVDICIDQGGCCETSRPTTHRDPTYVVDGIVHYCVTNMPGAVGRTSTHALCHATLPYIQEVADLGLDGFLSRSPHHLRALNLRGGRITHPSVAEAFPELPCEI